MVKIIFGMDNTNYTLELPLTVKCAFTRHAEDSSLILEQRNERINGEIFSLWKQLEDAKVSQSTIKSITGVKDDVVCYAKENLVVNRSEYAFTTDEDGNTVSTINITWVN